jgi:inorganic pyrophosphatase
MRTNRARHAILSETATVDGKTGELRVVIETPKGSRNKYDYAPECDCMELGTVLPGGDDLSLRLWFCAIDAG